MNPSDVVFVAGHRGMVGSAIVRALTARGFTNIVTRTRAELDLREQKSVELFFSEVKPQTVFVAAGKVGGIQANAKEPASFMYDNLAIAMNIVHSAAKHGTRELLYLGSSCVYPNGSAQPFSESSILSGPIETTNEGYGLAKIAGMKLCEFYHRQYGHRFLSAIPAGLYGPLDHFDPSRSHVIPAMLRSFHNAKVKQEKSVTLWGSGFPVREFLFVDDLPAALFEIIERYEGPGPINVGLGTAISIRDLATAIAEVVGFEGSINFDTTKPDGAPKRTLDAGQIKKLVWRPTVPLTDGLQRTYRWSLETGILGSTQPEGISHGH